MDVGCSLLFLNVVDTCVTLKCNYLIPSIKLLPPGSPSVSCKFLKLCTLKQGYMLLILMCLSFCVDVPIDGDNPDHISWIYERALERADEFGIQGVTYRLTQGRLTVRQTCVLYAAHSPSLVSCSLVS